MTTTIETKQCTGCGQQLVRGSDERATSYVKRQYCSTNCADRARYRRNRNTAAEQGNKPRNCRHCDKQLVQHLGESPSTFARRRHCGTSCARLAAGKRTQEPKREPAVPLLDLTWQNRARCNGTDRELFFADESRDKADHARVEQARAICARCPVRTACLDYAMATNAYGIWSGTTREQRKQKRGTT